MAKPGLQVVYCGVCTLPPEYCEYGKSAAECRTWLVKSQPELCQKIYGSLDLHASAAPTATEAPTDQISEKSAAKKKTKAPEVIIKKEKRRGHKQVTIVNGLDHFGVKLSDAAKKMSKKFSCGASVSKTATGEDIDIQGDVIGDLVKMLITDLKISQDSIFVLEGSSKHPGADYLDDDDDDDSDD
eukprot:TRINITY_DN4954_c0_g1_i1.p1 TRINITY_DN4954_c0_g1~~TRINITY_DN4954_c0_g1_i1.p1  ORF type:complete len:209 (-),score=34.58 TRINITY_DN4954_c0_g1_i1:650-1204(-)